MKSNTPVVVVIGSTGTGKSALCNTLCGDSEKKKYPESEKPDSYTYKTTKQTIKWFGEESESEFVLLDTPGLGDSQNRDTQHIAEMVEVLKEVQNVNAFIIAFNGQNPRLDEHLRAMMKIFERMFGKQYLENTLVVFTRWPMDALSKKIRAKNKDSEELRVKNYNEIFSKEFGLDIINHPVKCFFTDNSYTDPDILECLSDDAVNQFKSELQNLKAAVENLPAFPCKDITAVKKELDETREQLGQAVQAQQQAEIKNQELGQELATKSDVLSSLQSHNDVLELPYKDGVVVGMGIDALSGNPCASAFKDSFEIPKLSDNLSKDDIQYKTISNSGEYAETTVACAKTSFKGWGLEVAANFAYNKNFSKTHNEILFVAQRKIEYAAQTIAKLPPLSEEAKRILQDSTEEFHNRYGHYVIIGYKKYASVTGVVKISSGMKAVDTSTVASLSASWSNGFGVKADATAQYENALKEKSEFKLSDVKVTCEGTDIAVKIESTISELHCLISDFQNAVKNGGVIKCFLLWDYRMSEEYLTINSLKKRQISRPFNTLSDHVILQFLRLRYLEDYFEALPVRNRAEIGDSFLNKISEAKTTIKNAVAKNGTYNGTIAEALEIELLSRISPPYKIEKVFQYDEWYSDRGTGAAQDLSVWKPVTKPGFYNLGYVFTRNRDRPSYVGAYIIQANDPDLIREPIGWTFNWNDRGTGGNSDGSIWTPKAPEGYVALGSVALHISNSGGVSNANFPDIRCVHKSLVEETRVAGHIWWDSKSRGHHDGRVWGIADSPFAYAKLGHGDCEGQPAYKLKEKL